MKIRPLQDRVIVRRVKEEEKTKGGLYIPDTAKEKPVEGTVLAVGNGKVLEDGSVRKLDIKEGDRVIIDNLMRLRPGAEVTEAPVKEPAAAAANKGVRK